MELWVRSQDRSELVNVKELYLGNVEETMHHYPERITKYKCTEILSNDFILGQYKSKERALEVLDEIQHTMWERSQVPNWTYEMPKG